MNNNTSLTNTNTLININIEGIDKLANTFAGIIGDVFDVISPQSVYERKQRRLHEKRMSEEKTKLDIISLNDNYEKELYNRTTKRLILEEMQNQENFETIAQKSVKYLNEKVSDEHVDTTWARKFFDKSRVITDVEMQEVWAKILSNEITQPGSFSIRAMNVLENLTKRELEIFQNISTFVIHNGVNHYFIFDEGDAINFDQRFVNFNDLLVLDSLNLITINKTVNILNYTSNNLNESIFFNSNKLISIVTQNVKNIRIPQYLLTNTGKELYRLSSPVFNRAYIQKFANFFKNFNATVELSNLYINDEKLYDVKDKEILLNPKTKPLF